MKSLRNKTLCTQSFEYCYNLTLTLCISKKSYCYVVFYLFSRSSDFSTVLFMAMFHATSVNLKIACDK